MAMMIDFAIASSIILPWTLPPMLKDTNENIFIINLFRNDADNIWTNDN